MDSDNQRALLSVQGYITNTEMAFQVIFFTVISPDLGDWLSFSQVDQSFLINDGVIDRRVRGELPVFSLA